MRIAGNQINPDRHPTDFYPTDDRWTDALLREVDLRGPVWEPAAGEGHIARVLELYGYETRSTDLTTGQDFLSSREKWPGSIVTNPPYSLVDEFIHHALDSATEHVAMLVRDGHLGGQRRYRDLWKPRPPSLVLHVVNRMTVNGKASQFNHVWVVWDPAIDGPTRLAWTLAA